MLRGLLVFILVINCCHSVQSTAQPQEIRLGILRHDVKSGLKNSYEKSYDVNGEYLFTSFQGTFWKTIFSPRVHVGASINVRSATNQFYSGLTWHVPLGEIFFLELSFGGEVHDGEIKKKKKNKKALGSRFLFRESVAVGVKPLDKFNISLFVDHASNGGLASPNPGLTGAGVRLGYQF